MGVKLGASPLGAGRCRFRVWAPHAKRLEVRIVAPRERRVELEPSGSGYYEAVIEDVPPGSLYLYRLDGKKERPDPASRHQPQGVHKPSQVVDTGGFAWRDSSWKGLRIEDLVFYELHVGTFTPEGTFEAVIPFLDELKELGVTAVELMPVAQFPGSRNWGYDGVYPFAVQSSYGGPDGLHRLVDACHQRGLAVALDVVYNHLGPEGNYLADFGPYFTERYRTPWGPAINLDGPDSDEVRQFFIQNALYWFTEFHLDALRLDAIHGIFDFSAKHFLAELGEVVKEEARKQGRPLYLIPESDLNDSRVVRPREQGGYGLDAQWSDDFHHALHALLTGERNGYYQDFGTLAHLIKAWMEGFVYTGQYSAYRRRRHGNSSREIPAHRFIVFVQNHDQVGNRMNGERLTQLVSFESLKLAAGIVLLSPSVPLLFMGEEYGETAPFLYFVSHSDPDLVAAVRTGRRKEFARFDWQGEIPDPQDENTFHSSRLRHPLRHQEPHRTLRAFYQELLRLRRERPALARLSNETLEVAGFKAENVLLVRRWTEREQVAVAFNFDDTPHSLPLPVPAGQWQKLVDSAEPKWGGSGTPLPDRLHSQGQLSLTLGPKAFVLLTRAEGTRT